MTHTRFIIIYSKKLKILHAIKSPRNSLISTILGDADDQMPYRHKPGFWCEFCLSRAWLFPGCFLLNHFISLLCFILSCFVVGFWLVRGAISIGKLLGISTAFNLRQWRLTTGTQRTPGIIIDIYFWRELIIFMSQSRRLTFSLAQCVGNAFNIFLHRPTNWIPSGNAITKESMLLLRITYQ